MKYNGRTRYIYIGLTALAVIVVAICFGFFVTRSDQVRQFVDLIGGILAPIIYGAVMAYLMNPVYKHIRSWLTGHTASLIRSERARGFVAAFFATALSIVILCVAVTGLIALMIPELISSIASLIESFPSTALSIRKWLMQLFDDNPSLESQVLQVYAAFYSYLQNFLQTQILPNLTSIAGRLSSQVIYLINLAKNVLIGLIVMAYFLNIRDRLLTQGKMIIYSILPLRVANKLLEELRYANNMFGGFIIGKIVDSIIIAFISFVVLTILKMPFVLLISVIIGCTNIIPFFGPFIGAIPSAVLILLVSPVKCLYFIIFILALQIFDGYILGPRILGGSTGVSSFWVLFSILFFGGLFGFVGMIIAVPTFAVIYRLIKEFVFYRLEKKNLSVNYEDYLSVEDIAPSEDSGQEGSDQA